MYQLQSTVKNVYKSTTTYEQQIVEQQIVEQPIVEDHDAFQAAKFRIPLVCLHAFCSNEMENCVRMSKLSQMKMSNNSSKMSLNSLVNGDDGDGDRGDHDENEIFDPMYHDHDDGFDGDDDEIEIVNFDLVFRILPIAYHAAVRIVAIRQPAQHMSCFRHGFWIVNGPSWHLTLVHHNQNSKPAWLLLLV